MPIRQYHFRIQATARLVETRVHRQFRRYQGAVAREFHLVGIRHGVALQAMALVLFGRADEGLVQRETGQSQEGDQANTGGQQLPGPQRTRAPSYERIAPAGWLRFAGQARPQPSWLRGMAKR